jgi:putative oxidoreductase
MNSLAQTRRSLLAIAAKLSWFPPALARLTLGVIFVGTGWGKLHNLEKVTEFFTQLHVPAPSFSAALVGATELVCGSLLLIGLIARLAAIPLIVTMCVAIATAKSGDIEGIRDLLGVQEFDYVVLLAWIAIAGAGALSVDRALAKQLERSEAGQSGRGAVTAGSAGVSR